MLFCGYMRQQFPIRIALAFQLYTKLFIQIDRVVPVAGKDELTNFNLIFWSKARKDITDGHIWFSIYGEQMANLVDLFFIFLIF